jgi:hypothetical protein
MSVEQSPETSDVIERLTALHRPCPACGALLVGARCAAREPGTPTMTAFLGLVCTGCDAMFHLGNEGAA